MIDDAGGEGNELAEVAAIEDELGDLFAGDGEGDLRRFCLHGAELGTGDLDGRGDGADGELGVDAFGAGDAEGDAGGLVLFKAGCGDGEAVGAGLEGGEGVLTTGVGGDIELGALRGVGEGDGGVRDDAAAGVSDTAVDGAGLLRGEAEAGGEEEETTDGEGEKRREVGLLCKRLHDQDGNPRTGSVGQFWVGRFMASVPKNHE